MRTQEMLKTGRIVASSALIATALGAAPCLGQAYDVDDYYTSDSYNRRVDEARDSQRQFAELGMQNLRNNRMMNDALNTCRKASGGCHGRFTPNPAVHAGPGLIAQSMGKTPAEVQQFTQVANALLNNYGQTAGRLALARNDIAASMAYAFVNAVIVYNGAVPNPSPAMLAKVTDQARQILSNDGNIAMMDNAHRQARYEQLAIIGTYLDAEMRAAKAAGDAPRQVRLRAQAAGLVRDLTGAQPERFTLTANGVVVNGAEGRPSAPSGTAPHLANTPAAAKGSTGLPIPNSTTSFTYDPGAVINPQDLANLAAFDQIVRSRGGNPHDLAWGAVTSFAISYFILRDVQMTDRQIKGTVVLARRLLLESDAGGALSDRDKQQAYERLSSRAMESLNSWRYNQRERANNNNDPRSELNNGYAINQVTQAQRQHAQSSIESLLSPYKLADFNMTPDGLVKVR